MRLHVPIKLRWSDLDAYGHVNNAEMLRLLEEARILAFWVTDNGAEGASLDESAVGGSTAILDGRPGSDTLTLIARQEVCYEIFSPAGVVPRQLFTRAASTLVMVDAASERPRRITDRERAAWSPYLDDPVAFKRR
jgi:acyl-CoA thioester hydrolase